MNSELLFISSDYDWLDKELQRGQARPRSFSDYRQIGQIPERWDIPNLPTDISTEAAMLKGKQLRALKFGEWLGSGARAVVTRIANLTAWLNGNSRDAERVKHIEEHRKAA